MLDKQMEKALNEQINAEFYSAFLYLSMAAQFDDMGLAGGGSWMRVQYQEEVAHAMKMFDYVVERGGRVKLTTIEAPKVKWASALTMFKDALAHEEKVTGLINGLVDLAIELRDHATNQFLQWFIAEQVEEEATAGEQVHKVKLAGESPAGLYVLDKEWGTRIFHPPAKGD
jgi:ferritin